MLNKILLTMLIGLSLSSCSSVKEKPIVVSTEHINPCRTPPAASVIVMRGIKFHVTKDPLGILWVSISPDDYTKMSLNTADILALLKQKNAINEYYKLCYEDNK